jgi:glycosyltransferase involved in cell wall biosynthesis
MRVLHVMEATIGGTRRHIGDVAAGQVARGIEVHLAVSTERQPEFEGDLRRLERMGVSVMRLPMVRAIRPSVDFAHVRALARHMESVRPDVVHTHSSKAGVLGRAASIASGVGKRVHTPHTFAFLFDAMFSPLKRRLFRGIEAHLSAETQAVIAVSSSEARTFRSSGVVPESRIRVVPNGIDPAPWTSAQPIDRLSLGVADGEPLAAVVGLLNVAKGQDLALEMLAQPGFERLHILFAGHGEMRDELESEARTLGVAARVRFLGFRSDVPALLATADFTLVPSRWEGMPYIVMESMACGRPVVATAVDGARDLVEPGVTGELAREITSASLAEATLALLARSPAERARMGALGRERVLARHTAARMIDDMIDVYREIA